jgi:hypothetical protein
MLVADMGQKRTRASAAEPRVDAGVPAPRSRKPWVFFALDLLFAAVYIGVAPLLHSADGSFEAGTVTMGVALVAAGIGTVARRRWGWWLGVIGCAIVLLGALLLLVLLGAGVGYLWGTFGALGKGTASMALIMMALVIEVYVLLPAFQLWYLVRSHPARRLTH